eukprot:8545400-Pyramimonas_sp.AAC.1
MVLQICLTSSHSSIPCVPRSVCPPGIYAVMCICSSPPHPSFSPPPCSSSLRSAYLAALGAQGG